MMGQRTEERHGGFFSRMRGKMCDGPDGRMEDFARCGEYEGRDAFHDHPGFGNLFGLHGSHGHHDMRELFMKRFGGHLERFANMRRGVFDPHGFLENSFEVDVRDEKEEYLVQARLPGIKKESIRLDRFPGMLVIAIEGEETVERPLYLAHCDEENVHANYHDGVLEIRAPKSKGQKIEIE